MTSCHLHGVAQTNEIKMYTYIFAGALLLAGLGGGTALAQQQSLSLSQAVYLARQANDPTVARLENKAIALEERSVALSQLPDPTVRGSVENLPLDSFRLDQENMTQVRMTVRQAFPAGNTLDLKGQKSREKAAGIRAQKELVLRKIDLSIRTHWYDLFYWTRAQANLQKNKRALKEMIEALQGSFASGDRLAQHVLRVEFELSLLEDQLAEMKRRADRARAELGRYIGSAADQLLPSTLPEQRVPQSYAQLEAALKQHPAVLVEDVEIAVQGTNVSLSQQVYQPAWALDGSYGSRSGGRTDFASIGVTLSIPLFTANRQDRNVSAAMQEQSAARLGRAAILLDLRRQLGVAHADWRRIGERITLYEGAVLKRARETASASYASYGQGKTDFPELVRARLTQLDTEIQHTRLQTDRAKAWATLQYLGGME